MSAPRHDATKPFYRSQDYPECGDHGCKLAPEPGYNPTRRCPTHHAEYRALCGVAPSERWSPREDDGPTAAYNFGVMR